MNEIENLLKYKWEKYVGRRQPPLRGELAFCGVLKWFKDWGFEEDFSKLYIYFSKLTDKKGIISDHYININLRKIIVEKFKIKIMDEMSYAGRVLNDFREKTKKLKDFSLDLSQKNFANESFIEIFKDFCQMWEDFGPNLYVFLLLTEACENIILDNYPNDPEARAKLMNEVSSQVESEFFSSDKKIKNKDASYFDNKYQTYIKLLIKMTEYRDQRKVVYEDCWYKYAANFFRELEIKSGLKEKVNFLSKEKIIKVLQGHSLNFSIQLPSIVYGHNKEILYAYGEKVKVLQNKILKATVNFTDELKGTVANKGRASGKTRLIEPHVENQEFEQGEILITRMTTPDLMPLIKKALAIVTDEGGVTCHAAIVSREFDIPCIIGTKYATQVFEDGDMVEVDADNGLVKKFVT